MFEAKERLERRKGFPQKELKSRIAEAERIQKQQAEREDKARSFTHFIKEVTDVTLLNADILSKLVKRITIGQARKNPITGAKEQDIDVEFALC